MRLRPRPLIGLLALTASCAALAGTVNVTFINPSQFEDAGNTTWEEKDNLLTLQRHLEALGQQMLPADQTLNIEVLDVDLAGTVERSRRDGSEVRVIRGRTDFPRMHVRFALNAGGQTVRTGDEWVVNLNFARGFAPFRENDIGLGHEKRMLEAWFKMRFAPAAPPAD